MMRKDKNIFRLSDGRYGIDISRKYRDENGEVKEKRVRRIIGIGIKEAREERDREQLKLGGKHYRPESSKLTLEIFAEKYIEQHAKKNKSCIRDENALDGHIKPHFGKHRLSEITTGMILEYQAKRQTELSYREKPTNPATVNREVSLLKSMFNRALEWEDLGECRINWRRVKKLHETERDRTLSRDEFERLIAAAEQVPYLRDFLLIALNTGMRKSEVLNLKWTQVDFDNRTISLSGNQRKNKKPLIIPLNQEVLGVLAEKKHGGEYVFMNPETKDHLKDLPRSFKSACRRAKISDLRPHDLRHCFGTELAVVGVGVLAISKLLGHSSTAMTQRYINRMDDRLREDVEKIEDRFSAKRRQVDDTSPAGASIN